VWGPGGASLQQSLLGLPLWAMEAFLASDKLFSVFCLKKNDTLYVGIDFVLSIFCHNVGSEHKR
jgi:hypothetical protein